MMKKSYTLNELISFVNSEKSGADLNDKDIVCQENRYQKDNLLDSRLSISPDNRIISNILNYSRALSVVNTKSSGNFSLMMN